MSHSCDLAVYFFLCQDQFGIEEQKSGKFCYSFAEKAEKIEFNVENFKHENHFYKTKFRHECKTQREMVNKTLRWKNFRT